MPEHNGSPEPGPDAGVAELQADIDRTRNELGDTAEALAAKFDVPGQVRQKVDYTKQEVAAAVDPLRRNAVPIGAGVGVLLLVLMVRRRRRRARS